MAGRVPARSRDGWLKSIYISLAALLSLALVELFIVRHEKHGQKSEYAFSAFSDSWPRVAYVLRPLAGLDLEKIALTAVQNLDKSAGI